MMRKISCFLLACILSTQLSAQTDEINISASFAQSIALRITSGASINLTFSTLNDYKGGKSGVSYFEVSSSTSFNVDFSCTPFTNADGDEIALENLTYRLVIFDPIDDGKGTRWNFGTPNTSDGINQFNDRIKGPVNYATTSPITLLIPGSEGNAGNYTDNQFKINFWLGHPSRNSLPEVNLPTLLDQNIAPGTYTCTVTLEAIPVIL